MSLDVVPWVDRCMRDGLSRSTFCDLKDQPPVVCDLCCGDRGGREGRRREGLHRNREETPMKYLLTIYGNKELWESFQAEVPFASVRSVELWPLPHESAPAQ